MPTESPTGTITAFVTRGFRAHSIVGIRFVWIVWVWVWVLERRGHPCGRCSLAAAAVGVVRVVERNWDCTPVGNEQRTIRLVLVVVDSSCWNKLPGLRSYPEIYVLPRPYGGLGLAQMGVDW